MTKIICGRENSQEFNDALRRHAPDFHILAKELYQAGMIPGLSGSTLELGPIHPASSSVEKTEVPQTTCQQCRHWIRDTRGDGTGIGQCRINSRPSLLKWPGQMACTKIEVIE